MSALWQSVAVGSAITGGDPVVNVPAGTVDGDLLIAVGAATASTSFATPAGWTIHPATINAFHPLWTRTASSEPASYTFVTTGAGNAIVQIVRISGWASIDAAAGVVGTAGLVIPSVTSAGADRLLFQMANKTNALTTFTPPASATERYDAQTGGNFTYAGGDQIVGSGATGTRTWTPAAGGATGCAYMLAIAPIPPEEGTFTGGYDFSSIGFIGQAGPGEGTFTGGFDFSGSGFVGEADGVHSGAFTGGFDFAGSFTGSAPVPPVGFGRWTPGGRDRFTARRTPKNRRRSR